MLSADGSGYNIWKNDIELWCQVTKTPIVNRAPQIYLSLTGQPRQAATKLNQLQLRSNEGVRILLQCLDEAFLPNKTMRLFNANNKLRNVIRKPGGLVKNYIIEFDNAKFLLEQEGLQRDDTLLGLDLLAQCKLSEDKNQLVMSGLSEVTYETMKKQLSSIFFNEDDHYRRFDTADKQITPSMENKSGDILYTNAYYQRGRGRSSRGRSASREWKRPRYERDNNDQRRSDNDQSRSDNDQRRSDNEKQNSFRTQNPLGEDGKPTKCVICQSILHWARKCPHSYESNQRKENTWADKSRKVNFNMFVAMVAEDEKRENGRLQSLLDETKGCAVIDSGCATTVCGEEWAEDFIENLCDEEKDNVHEEPSNEYFTFGDGHSVKSLKRLSIPCWIQGMERGYITTEVVKPKIPLLLSKTSMKKQDMVLDFKNDTIICGNEVIQLKNTGSGHYALPLGL